jgi:hypothetical protein
VAGSRYRCAYASIIVAKKRKSPGGSSGTINGNRHNHTHLNPLRHACPQSLWHEQHQQATQDSQATKHCEWDEHLHGSNAALLSPCHFAGRTQSIQKYYHMQMDTLLQQGLKVTCIDMWAAPQGLLSYWCEW